MAQNQSNEKPAFNVFVVIDRGRKVEPFWLKVGAAFTHKDGKGLNIVLQALPPNGRLALREYDDNKVAKNN